jgi:hypothetical protein
MMPLDPRKMLQFRNRIDLLKKTIWDGTPYGNPDPEKYFKDPELGFGLRRLVPKKPSRYALRKNTKRARKYAESAKLAA